MQKRRLSRHSLAGNRQSVRGTGKRQERQRALKAPVKRRRTSLRAGLAVISGRTVGALSRRLHLGGGTSVVGLVAQRLHPGIVGHLAAQLEHGSVIVTGTNGKTTTSGFIAAVLRDAGLRVWRNREGSNLMGGLASSLVMRALPNGQLRRFGRAISIFEVDEAVVPQAVAIVHPRVAVFTNLFRDQLDRYGEVDSVMSRWRETVHALPPETVLVLNADDPAIASLGEEFDGRTLYFGIENLGEREDHPAFPPGNAGAPARHEVVDTRVCPRCGGEYSYEERFYSHLGRYVCRTCGRGRPALEVKALRVQVSEFERQRMTVAVGASQQDVVIPLPGLYNVYNALAAIAAAHALGSGWEPIVTGIEQFKPIFGRGERIQAEGRTLRLLLAKNPTGMNEVLRTLFSDAAARHLLFILNDNGADGRDISWIWDVDFEQVAQFGQSSSEPEAASRTLVVAGTRALDLALRLKYAGIEQEQMTIVRPAPLRATRALLRLQEQGKGNGYAASKRTRLRGFAQRTSPDMAAAPPSPVPKGHVGPRYGVAAALDAAIQQTPIGETLFVVPTYTGLLEVQAELERRGLTPHYWEGDGR